LRKLNEDKDSWVHGKVVDSGYHIIIAQQRPVMMTVRKKNPEVVSFVWFVLKLGV